MPLARPHEARTLAWVIPPVLECGKHDGVGCFVHVGSAIIIPAFIAITEDTIAAILEELENQALQLSPKERGELIYRLIVSLEGEPELLHR